MARKLKDIFCPVEWSKVGTNSSLYSRINHHNTLLAYKELQYGLVQSFVSIHGASKTEDIPSFAAGDVNRLLCADNFCYDTIYKIIMQDKWELYKIQGLGRTRLDRIFKAINNLAGFDIIATIAEFRQDEELEQYMGKFEDV